MKYSTTYRCAVEWLNTNLVLLNNITEIDCTVYDNFRSAFDEDTEIFQWFITDASDDDVEWLEEHFGLLFTYSELLDKWILCVTHYGTSWDYVMIDTDIKAAERKEGEGKQRN